MCKVLLLEEALYPKTSDARIPESKKETLSAHAYVAMEPN